MSSSAFSLQRESPGRRARAARNGVTDPDRLRADIRSTRRVIAHLTGTAAAALDKGDTGKWLDITTRIQAARARLVELEGRLGS